MTRSVILVLFGATVLLVVPTEVIGATEPWEQGMVRLTGIVLALHGLVTLSAARALGTLSPDATLRRLTAAVGFFGVTFLLTGNGLFLVLSFSLAVGLALNRTMKRLDLVFERAQERVGWRVPQPDRYRSI